MYVCACAQPRVCAACRRRKSMPYRLLVDSILTRKDDNEGGLAICCYRDIMGTALRPMRPMNVPPLNRSVLVFGIGTAS